MNIAEYTIRIKQEIVDEVTVQASSEMEAMEKALGEVQPSGRSTMEVVDVEAEKEDERKEDERRIKKVVDGLLEIKPAPEWIKHLSKLLSKPDSEDNNHAYQCKLLNEIVRQTNERTQT